jgi:hypothetical protein
MLADRLTKSGECSAAALIRTADLLAQITRRIDDNMDTRRRMEMHVATAAERIAAALERLI